MKRFRIRYTNALGGGAKDCTIRAHDTEQALERFNETRQGKTRGCKVLVCTEL